MNAEGSWTYAQACEVVNALQAIGCDAGVTVGGVSFNPGSRANAARLIIESAGGQVVNGLTSQQSMQMQRSLWEGE